MDAVEELADLVLNYRPTRSKVASEVWAKIAACPLCQEARNRNWPPSRLCDAHFRIVSATEDENRRRECAEGSAIKMMVRAYMAEYRDKKAKK